jgi:plastocyanin
VTLQVKMIRLVVIGALALLLSACPGGTTVDPGDVKISTRSPSPSPEVTKSEPSTPPTTKEPTEEPPPTGPERKDHKLKAVDYAYEPTEFQVRTGDRVIFTNEGDSDHSFTVDETDIDSGPIASGDSKTIVIDLEAGEYSFHCTVIPYMVGGRLVVYS